MSVAATTTAGRHAPGRDDAPIRRLAATPGAPGLAAAGLLGRIAMGMIPLALILTVTGGTGAFGAAGAVIGAYALGVALGGPLRGRLADRLGARPVLLATGAGHAAALLAFAGAAGAGAAGPALAAAGLLIGLSLPPTGPVMRTTWDRTLADEELRLTAQALESVALDIGLLTGPLVVALLAGCGAGDAAPLVAAALTVASCIGVGARAPGRIAGTAASAADRLGALRPAPLRRTLVVAIFAIGSLFPVELAVVAFASEHDHRAAAGPLIGAFSLASLLAGLGWSAMRRRTAPRPRELTVVLAVLAAGYAALALAGGLVVLAAGLVLAGMAVSPMLIVLFARVRAAAPQRVATEAFSWTSSLGYAGGASAAWLAGAAIERHGAAAGFLVAAGMAALACALALGPRSWLTGVAARRRRRAAAAPPAPPPHAARIASSVAPAGSSARR